MTKTEPTPAGVLAEVERKRGYVLPYHRMLAGTDPGLLAAYDAYYERLTLMPRALAPEERETVWIALQVATREEHGQIHLRRAVAAGMDEAAMTAAVAIAAAVEAWPALAFARQHWPAWTPPERAAERYLDLFAAATRVVEPRLAEIAATVCHAARRTHDGMALHLKRAFAADATLPQLSEAMSYLLLPAGGPCLIDAVAEWENAARAEGFPGPY
jgi:alkylhydroperoxidase/carboxymuconolactone decarboxylase family protein YurZ